MLSFNVQSGGLVMAVVERIEYELNEQHLDDVAASFVPEYLPKPPPTFDRNWYSLILTTAGACLGSIVMGWDLNMGAEFYVVAGLGLALCLFAVSLPVLAAKIDAGLVRLTRSSRQAVRRRLETSWANLFHTTIRWEFDEDGFGSATCERARTFPWTTLKRVRVHPRFWQLSTTNRDELMLPTEHLSEAVQSIIRRKSAELGVKFQERGAAS